MFYSRILVNSEVLPPLNVRGANVKDVACKPHTTKVLKQVTQVEDDAITQSGYNSLQANDGSAKPLPRTGIRHACSYDEYAAQL